MKNYNKELRNQKKKHKDFNPGNNQSLILGKKVMRQIMLFYNLKFLKKINKANQREIKEASPLKNMIN